MVGAGAVVTHSVPPHAIVAGNPARITGYADSPMFSPPAGPKPDRPAQIASRVPGVALINFPVFEDMRGALAVGEFPDSLPFTPKRFFSVYNVPGSEVRGAHAHLKCHQLFVCVQGRVNIAVDNGACREEFQLSGPEQGLYVPPLIWATQYRHAPETTLLVLASHPYAADDYVRDYASYLKRIQNRTD
jgi:dTDP-4-dehydrorhamnose 3,5-epimerase-like enzyme